MCSRAPPVPIQIPADSVMELIVDELLYLQLHGLELKDPITHSMCTIRVQLLFPMSDYPGMRSILGRYIKQHPAPYACPRTWHSGTHIHHMKTFYHTHAK